MASLVSGGGWPGPIRGVLTGLLLAFVGRITVFLRGIRKLKPAHLASLALANMQLHTYVMPLVPIIRSSHCAWTVFMASQLAPKLISVLYREVTRGQHLPA